MNADYITERKRQIAQRQAEVRRRVREIHTEM
jgi:hypothetical protein